MCRTGKYVRNCCIFVLSCLRDTQLFLYSISPLANSFCSCVDTLVPIIWRKLNNNNSYNPNGKSNQQSSKEMLDLIITYVSLYYTNSKLKTLTTLQWSVNCKRLCEEIIQLFQTTLIWSTPSSFWQKFLANNTFVGVNLSLFVCLPCDIKEQTSIQQGWKTFSQK